MPELVDIFDRCVRRNRSLPRVEWLRRVLRAPYLPRFRGSVEAIRNILSDMQYSILVLAVDHEEH